MLKMNTSQLMPLIDTPPMYKIKVQDTKENKEARFLQTLYKNKRYAGFLKTYAYFTQTYPKSVYTELISNMAAEVYFKLWQRDGEKQFLNNSMTLYSMLVDKYPKSILKERNQLIVAYSMLDQRNSIETIRRFEQFLKEFPNSESRDQAKEALAEAYLNINKFKEAFDTYLEIEKNGFMKKYSVKAIYRKGDVRFRQRKYKEALDLYKKALNDHPRYHKIFPNAYYNMAESQFWLGQFRESLNNYINFLKYFPSHSYGGYAMTRIGELQEILGADRRRVMAAFLESYFRFRVNPGSKVARVRLLSQRMKSMKKTELVRALEEIEDTAKTSTLSRMSEFTNLMVADGLHRRKEFLRALNMLTSFYQKPKWKKPYKTSKNNYKPNASSNVNRSPRKTKPPAKFI